MALFLASRHLYRPIKSYQTRIIRLHGDAGAPNSPLTCDLYHANILHPRFEGLGVLAPSDNRNEDSLVSYDALSYTWGSGELTRFIFCNGVKFPITENLHNALQALRYPQKKTRYLWVDGLCINQSDDDEKGEQVWNMLTIYQKAATVVAWLGWTPADSEHALVALSQGGEEESPAHDLDIPTLRKGLVYLYENPWFTRIWVQQEIFAARKLVFYCGKQSFTWSSFLSDPNSLLKLRQFKKLQDQANRGNSTNNSELREIPTLNRLAERRLQCFKQFSGSNVSHFDLIDLLLDTGTLNATNPRDYIYGILGMTNFHTQAVSIDEWMTLRGKGTFIPIDYSADMISILCSITWAGLMKGGLSILAKFKAFPLDYNPDEPHEQDLPSWVIDWRLTSRLLYKELSSNASHLSNAISGLDTAWEVVVRNAVPPQWKERLGMGGNPPSYHMNFCRDNSRSPGHCTELILRGVIDHRFIVSEGQKGIWSRGNLYGWGRTHWKLPFTIHPTDLVVYMLGFPGVGVTNQFSYEVRPQGLWLLRPALRDRFRLLAFLPTKSTDQFPFYHRWQWKTTQQPIEEYYRLARHPDGDWHDATMIEGEWKVRKFIII